MSTTLETAAWNNSVPIQNDVVAEIAKLKEQNGRDLTVHGSGALVQTLMQQ